MSRRWLALATPALIALIATACHGLDPRAPSTRAPERSVWGGWVVVYLTSGARIQGELLAVSGGALHVLVGDDHDDGRGWTGERVTSLSLDDVREAKVYGYERESFWSYTYLAALYPSGFLLLPAMGVAVAVMMGNGQLEAHSERSYGAAPAGSEARAAAALSRWARFPRGMPRGIDPRAVIPKPGPARSPSAAAPSR